MIRGEPGGARICLTAVLPALATLSASCATAPAPAPADAGHTIALQHATEDAVASYISAQLNADPLYYYRHVNVRVDAGVATLSGYVWDTQAIYRARKIAAAVPGVTSVVTSGLELERNGRNSGSAR